MSLKRGQYVTLTSDHPDLSRYLAGYPVSGLWPLPVESRSSWSGQERVTFKLVDRAQMNLPPWWKIYIHACRWELMPLTFGPAFLAISSSGAMHAHGGLPTTFVLGIALLCSLFFVHVSGSLLNDYYGHLSGADRGNSKKGSQIIQKGWAQAFQVRRWALVNVILAALVASVIVILKPLVSLVFGILGLTLVWAHSVLPLKFVRWGLADLIVLILYGPILYMGTLLALGVSLQHFQWFLSLGLGGLALVTIQAKYLGSLFRLSPSHFRSRLFFLPFDRLKWAYIFELVVVVVIFGISYGKAGLPWGVATAVFVPALFMSFRIAWRTLSARSPLSSKLVNLEGDLSWHTVFWIFGWLWTLSIVSA